MEWFPSLEAAICFEIKDIIRERHLVAQERLKDYIKVQCSFIKTIQMDFNKHMHDYLKKNSVSKDELHSAATGQGQVSKTFRRAL